MSLRLAHYLTHQPRAWLWGESILLVLLFGAIDYFTGWEVSVFLFYSLPILLMVRYADRRSAVLMAVICAAVWWWADHQTGHPYVQPWLQAWETVVRLVFFLFIVIGGLVVKSHIELLEHSRTLEQEIIRISEREQRRIGQDLHDGLCQYFAAVGCAAGSLRYSLDRRGAEETPAAAEVEVLIHKGVEQTRGLARGLFPVENDEGGLQSALRELTETTSRLQNVECILECPEPAPYLDNACSTQVFRIVQEALNNAIRHGHARRVVIRLESQGERVRLTIADNGSGLPPGPLPRNGMGLRIMTYRAQTIGGLFDLSPGPNGGAVVSCTFNPAASLASLP